MRLLFFVLQRKINKTENKAEMPHDGLPHLSFFQVYFRFGSFAGSRDAPGRASNPLTSLQSQTHEASQRNKINWFRCTNLPASFVVDWQIDFARLVHLFHVFRRQHVVWLVDVSFRHALFSQQYSDHPPSSWVLFPVNTDEIKLSICVNNISLARSTLVHHSSGCKRQTTSLVHRPSTCRFRAIYLSEYITDGDYENFRVYFTTKRPHLFALSFPWLIRWMGEMTSARTYHWFVGVLLELHKSDARNVLQLAIFDAVGVVAIQKRSQWWRCDAESLLAVYFSCNDIVCVQKSLRKKERKHFLIILRAQHDVKE